MNKKCTVKLLLLAAAFILGVCGSAYALPAYLATFDATYGTTGSALDTCALCHISPGGGGPRNPYGNAFLAAGHNFQAIENLDSDGDGFTNIVEINARTFPGDPASHPAAATVPVPTSQQIFPAFIAPDLPAPNANPSLSQVIGVGSIAGGGASVTIGVNTGTFAGNVDVFFALYAPALSPNVFLLTPTGLQTLSAGLASWKAGVNSVNENPFGTIPVSVFPPGTYNLFLLVTPAGSAGSLSAFYLWQTSFTIPVPITTTLSGSQEVPPTNSSGTGTANLTVDLTTGAVVGSLTFSGLSGPATFAHFHQAPAGSNGNPPIIPLTVPVPAASSGVIPISVTMTAAQLSALAANQIYLNIHTAANPNGEIRGQILYPAGAPTP